MAENYYGATDIGRLRSNNEDAFITQEVAGNRFIAACVIDGVGGYEGGEVAAAIARDSIIELLDVPFEDPGLVLPETIKLANKRIIEEKNNNNGKEKMACVLTVALADIDQNKFYYAHVGDTRLYLLRHQSLVKVTKDHSFIGFLEDSGRLTEEAAMQHPKRNEVNKALGFDTNLNFQDDYLETGVSPFLPGDILLLCSDGLTDMVRSQEIVGILTADGSLKHKVDALINAANDSGGKDNITVVLVKNDKAPVKHAATKPVIDKTVTHGSPIKIKNEEVPAVDERLPEQSPTPKNKNKRLILFIVIGICVLLLITMFWMTAAGYWNSAEINSPSNNVTA